MHCMESSRLTGILKLFIAHAKLNNILELDKNDLRENFFQFKNSEKYANLLRSYEYDENNICFQFEKELNDLIRQKQIVEHKKIFYIYGVYTDIEKAFMGNINSLVRDMVRDYIGLNMQKQKVNMG